MEKGVSTVHKADTLEELAEQMGVPVDTFMATVEDFNSYCGTQGPDPVSYTHLWIMRVPNQSRPGLKERP